MLYHVSICNDLSLVSCRHLSTWSQNQTSIRSQSVWVQLWAHTTSKWDCEDAAWSATPSELDELAFARWATWQLRIAIWKHGSSGEQPTVLWTTGSVFPVISFSMFFLCIILVVLPRFPRSLDLPFTQGFSAPDAHQVGSNSTHWAAWQDTPKEKQTR